MTTTSLTKQDCLDLAAFLSRKEYVLLQRAVDELVVQATHTLITTDPTDIVKITRQQTLIKEVPRILAAIKEDVIQKAESLQS